MEEKANDDAAAGSGGLPLPVEILSQILASLPVVTILRCTAVCKDWNSLIRSSEFVSHHRSSSSTNENHPSLLLRRCAKSPTGEVEEHLSLHSGSSSSIAISSPFKPRSDDPRRLRLFGSLHGLICLCDNYKDQAYVIYVWNPAVRRFIDLPSPTLNFRIILACREATLFDIVTGLHRLSAVLGFGYDSRRNDYKVVRIVYPPLPDCSPGRAEVYALKEGRWREVLHVEQVLRSCIVPRPWSQCFVDGRIYWPATVVGSESNCVLAFDVNEEGFRRIELPQELPGGGESRCISICESKVAGLLTVLYNTVTSCEILLLKASSTTLEEDSWVRFYSIVDPPGKLIGGLWQDKKVLLLKLLNRSEGDLSPSYFSVYGGEIFELCFYDYETQEIEPLGMIGMGLDEPFYAADYTESLVLLEPGVGVVSYRDPEMEPITRSVNFELEDEHLSCCEVQFKKLLS